MQGIRAYKSLQELPEKIDLAVPATAADTVADSTRDCGRANAASAIIPSEGFGETGRSGPSLTEVLRNAARDR